MTQGRQRPHAAQTLLARAARSSLLCLALASPLAFADEYGDVNNLIRAGKHADALAKADQFLSAKPRDPQMRFLRGVAQTESGKGADAITTFVKLTEDFPELPEPYNNLAVLYANANQFDKARAALEMAIRTNPSYATAHENLGDVYAKLASQAYSKALQLDGSNPAVQPKLALIRDLFSSSRGGKPITVAAAAPAPTPAPAATPAASAAKPVASAPRPAASAPVVVAAAPTASAPKPAASAPAPVAAASGNDNEAIRNAVNTWASAWSAKDMRAYLAAYGADFAPPAGANRKQWEEDRRARIVGKSSIRVGVSNLNVSVNGNRATAKFRQDYKADALAINSAKTLELVKSGDRWVIVKESTGG